MIQNMQEFRNVYITFKINTSMNSVGGSSQLGKNNFYQTLSAELKRIDLLGTTKREEKIIEGYIENKAIINGKKFLVFNSNDYLGLRFDKRIIAAEEVAARKFGSGPGAVRFISGTSIIHIELEKEIASFHNREAALVFSSAFTTNLAVIYSLLKKQAKDSLINESSAVIGDQLNHRCIIDGIRLSNLQTENKIVYRHLDLEDLEKSIFALKGKVDRILLISDGIFSMLGEYAEINKICSIVKKYDSEFKEGITLLIDDSHGVASFGSTGRGCEERCDAKADLLVGTFGKGFGVDGGYVVGDKLIINYFKESAATYIYSNPISPSTAAACLESVRIVKKKGADLINKLNKNIVHFKEQATKRKISFASSSEHAIQPVLIGDAKKAQDLTKNLFEKNILVTNISYPVVPKGRDEIRIQLSAKHTEEDLNYLLEQISNFQKNN